MLRSKIAGGMRAKRRAQLIVVEESFIVIVPSALGRLLRHRRLRPLTWALIDPSPIAAYFLYHSILGG
jgi:hypothetical protein